MRELGGVLLVLCATLLPALASEPVGDELGQVADAPARGERDAALHASAVSRPAPARLARVRDVAALPALPLTELQAAPRRSRLAADGGKSIQRPAPSLRCARYRPRSDCGDDAQRA